MSKSDYVFFFFYHTPVSAGEQNRNFNIYIKKSFIVILSLVFRTALMVVEWNLCMKSSKFMRSITAGGSSLSVTSGDFSLWHRFSPFIGKVWRSQRDKQKPVVNRQRTDKTRTKEPLHKMKFVLRNICVSDCVSRSQSRSLWWLINCILATVIRRGLLWSRNCLPSRF
jgi:hypothetical protein